MPIQLPSASAFERLPWPVRALLGCCTAICAVGLTYLMEPLRDFPLLLPFPTVVLTAWFLGMWGGVACSIFEAFLVAAFLTRAHFRFTLGNASEATRLALFLAVSNLLAWAIRRLADQRTTLLNRELQQRLALADSQRQLAEERAAAGEVLRHRDEELQLALRAHGMGLWVWDLPRGAIDWNDEVYRLLGREPGSITPSVNAWYSAIHRDDIEEVKESTERNLESGSEFYKLFRVIWPDGSVHWIESHSTCRRDNTGKALRLMGVLADVTDRKHSEEAMLRAEKLAVAGRLAASVAHEINNPLEAIANLLYLITLVESADEAHVHAEKALEELLRVSLITQSTLKFHRQVGAPKVTRLSDVIDSVLSLFRAKLLASEITVDVHADREVPISCMPTEAQQIFANLMSNAIEATPRGGKVVIRIRPSHDWREPPVQGMRVTFADSGTGMDRATMRRIFEPFFTTKAETGTGLGMWVVAQLAERHRGHVHVWSSQRPAIRGTVFSVFLPLGTVAESSPGSALTVEGTEELIAGSALTTDH